MGIPNPLRSFTLPISVSDNYWGDQNPNADEAQPYYKRAGYTTVRYPLSGLVGNFGDAELTYAHNQKYPDQNTNDTLLNNNIMAWLNGPEPMDPPPPEGANLYASYRACLFAPNYAVPGVPPGARLTLDGTALKPFKNPLTSKPYVSTDCVDIENQLGYTYGPGSFDDLSIDGPPRAAAVKPGFSARKLMVRGIDRALFQGSFLLTAHATVADDGGKTKEYYLGYHAVLSRYSVSNCANCRTHLEVIAHFSLNNMPEHEVLRAIFTVKVHHRGSVLPAGLKTVLKVRG
ncbi:hypothetical protein [Sorangium sp. So ce204]|uniref:hypothetical protein n=1 Tax=Sorangium sp. So ce204 TaxID=3133288 RepID=UPI003F5DFEBC